jgi:hypothetical protein
MQIAVKCDSGWPQHAHIFQADLTEFALCACAEVQLYRAGFIGAGWICAPKLQFWVAGINIS